MPLTWAFAPRLVGDCWWLCVGGVGGCICMHGGPVHQRALVRGGGSGVRPLRRRLPIVAPALALHERISGSRGESGWPSMRWPADQRGGLPVLVGGCWVSVRPQRQQIVAGFAFAWATTARLRWW